MTLMETERGKGMELRRKATARAVRLGRDLRAHRTAAGLSQTNVAKLTGINAATITRVETGNSVPQNRTMTTLLDTYRVRGAERERLLGLAAKANEPGWLDRFVDDQSISDRYATYISWETEAREKLEYEALLVPGLLQTEEYTRAVIAGTEPQLEPRDVERLVEVRRRRREALTKDEPLQLVAVLDEAVLHRTVGGPKVMAAQLTALAKENRPHVSVQVLPFGVGAHPGLFGSFVVLDDFSGPPLVVIESALNNVFLDEADDVRRYVTMFETLRTRALSPQDSATLLSAAARKNRR